MAKMKKQNSESQELVYIHKNSKRLKSIPYPRTLKAGTGKILAFEMTSTPIDSPSSLLSSRLQEDGYLLFRGLLNKNNVKKARTRILKEINHKNPSTKDLYPNLLERQDLARDPCILKILEADELFQILMKIWFGDQHHDNHHHDSTMTSTASFVNTSSITQTQTLQTHQTSKCKYPPPHPKYPMILPIPYKWLRAVPPSLHTGPHIDRVYLGAGSPSLMTVWIPLGDTPTSLGSLIVCPKSNSSPKFKELRDGPYGTSRVGQDGTESGWICEDPNDIPNILKLKNPLDLHWVSTDFQMGDVCFIGMDTLHMSAVNVENEFRISCDTRWMPYGDAYPPWWKN